VMGKGVGTIPLRVDHAAYRVADQRNVPTVLQWGKALGATLRRRDYAGTYVVLEKLADGSYRLELTADEPSGYIT